ncbi:MAG TPA: hypothetical protein PLF70_01340 [Candidatus Portnoybacteria bacterium]|mgnify:CR=1 FL=1|jgi:hypothetical protein|nr:hypothetical protein [Candidatus Portnoybacteria bacterium]MDD5752116.1 hypothetical protein [Candidatus Portnoybacteria bacterium]HOZ16597.1 hypothetical protein [Candidatus Portnoybacteria bacterium]HPH52313.1 hypothetical protein [Candidatus Portnoybacteria bacterium]HPJ80328.1 hypothetical protein [Candidatus Portnoybacteria bacterium]
MILVFQILLGVSIAGFLCVAIKKIPVLLNYPRHSFEEISLKQKIYEKIQKLKEKIVQNTLLREAIIPKTEKSLRKFNLFILKLHNLLTKITSHLRKNKQDENKDNQDDNFNLPT